MESILNEFMDEFQKNIPPVLCELKDTIDDHVRTTAETIIQKMHLVSREEFDTQLLLLRRSREKLAALEKKIEDMSKRLGEVDTTGES